MPLTSAPDAWFGDYGKNTPITVAGLYEQGSHPPHRQRKEVGKFHARTFKVLDSRQLWR
jgi:hypothetical protein